MKGQKGDIKDLFFPALGTTDFQGNKIQKVLTWIWRALFLFLKKHENPFVPSYKMSFPVILPYIRHREKTTT